ncbi:TPA: hypothetical protein ACH3X1_004223 [Trebouxia sp. C0004]
MPPGKEGAHYGSMVQVFKDRPKVTMHRRAPCNPLTQQVVSKDSVCCMMPLLSGRKYVRVGSGPLNSAFYTSRHNDFNNQILRPAFTELKIVQRMKGCATRVLRASTMCHLWHNEGFMFCYMGFYCSLVLGFKVFEVVKWLGGIS